MPESGTARICLPPTGSGSADTPTLDTDGSLLHRFGR